MNFALPKPQMNSPNVLNEPNPLNRQDGLQPNASAFFQFFCSSWKRQDFSLLVLDILSSNPTQVQINPSEAILENIVVVINRQAQIL